MSPACLCSPSNSGTTRSPETTPPVIEYLDVEFSQLRRDGEPLELLMLKSCSVRAPARYWIQVRDDHVVTLRKTSPVVRIASLDPWERSIGRSPAHKSLGRKPHCSKFRPDKTGQRHRRPN